MTLIRKIPIPMAALALGLAGLGNLLLPYSPYIRVACGVLAAAVALLVVARIVLDFHAVRQELANPAVLSVFPALFMATMLLATYLKPFAPGSAEALWITALALQFGVVALFTFRFVAKFDPAQVLPGWFLIFVGFVVASVTSPAFGMQPLGRVLLYIGLAGYAVVLPVVVYRVLRGEALPKPLLPTVAIFAAPPSLCLAGYLAVAEAKQPVVVYALLAVAAVSLAYVLSRLPGIVRAGFVPAYAALTFPAVISATAVKQSSAYLAASGAALTIPQPVVVAMDAMAAAAVLYVLVHYVLHLAVPLKA